MSGSPLGNPLPLREITRPRGVVHLLRELVAYRDLLWVLAARDLKVRYKQTAIGAAWAVLQPFLTMVVFTVFFGLLGRYPSTGDIPYAVTLYCALLPWQLFANAVTHAGESMVENRALVTKVYFSRLAIPVAPTIAALVDFAIAFVILIGLMAWYGLAPGWPVLLLPLWVAFAVMAALSIGLWMCALNALYRDVRYVLPFAVQLGFFVSPVVFETTAIIPEQWQAVYAVNPMVGVIEGFRWALLGAAPPPAWSVVVSVVSTGVLLLGGVCYFNRVERSLVDYV